MDSSLFNPGKLHLPQEALTDGLQAAAWGELVSNRIYITLSVISFIVLLTELLRMLPLLLDCYSRVKAHYEIEHSYTSAQMRTFLFWTMVIPFCLMLDRFSIYSPDYLDKVPAEWRSTIVILSFLGYLLLRHIIFIATGPKLSQEPSAMVHHAIYSYFIVMVLFMLFSCGVLLTFNASDRLITDVLGVEIIISAVFALYGTKQNLTQYCSGFATILYLCSLELIPAGILIACGTLF
ncbi:MAG: hypothetical protein KBS67_00750 [Bacteroidales bacterium]|nr:hypothetical protein [Candidatus Cryptobacteroides equifaecalis]